MKMSNILEMANHRGKRVKFATRGVPMQHIWGFFDLLVFEVILVSFRDLVSKWPVTKKRLAGE